MARIIQTPSINRLGSRIGEAMTATSQRTMFGLQGNDTLTSAHDKSLLVGGSGNDTYQIRDRATTVIYDEDGNDVVRFPQLNLAFCTISVVADRHLLIHDEMTGSKLVIADYETSSVTLVTSRGAITSPIDLVTNDTIRQTFAQSAIVDLTTAITDAIRTAQTAEAASLLVPSKYNDVLAGTDRNSSIDGLGGHDTITGGAFQETIAGGLGNDVLDGGDGIDTASYAGTTAVAVSLAIAGLQNTGLGYDTLVNFENLLGGSGNDKLTGDAGGNRLTGGNGADTLQGGGGDDTLDGGIGMDTVVYSEKVVFGNLGVDLQTGFADMLVNVGGVMTNERDTLVGIENVIGNAGADSLRGNQLGNRLDGGNGQDQLYGNGGDDWLIGGAGDDWLLGHAGNDYMDGGLGRDILRYDLTATTNSVTVDMAKGTSVGGVAHGSDRFANIEDVYAGLGRDTLLGDDKANTLMGLQGDDLVNGRGGNDVVGDSFGGRDTLIGGGGNDLINVWDAGDGDFDVIRYLDGLNSGDMLRGTRDVIHDGVDSYLDFSAAAEAAIRLGGLSLKARRADMEVGSEFDILNAIRFLDGNLQIDLNGDRRYTAGSDFSIAMTDDLAASVTAVTYLVETDMFMLS